jgi:hypothetical protein
MTIGLGEAVLARPHRLWLLALLAVLLVVAVMPVGVFTVDEAIYARMARAMADRHELAIDAPNGVPGAPPLVVNLTDEVGGRVAPQYPAGYAFIAAPFQGLFGIRGLYLINALAAIASVAFTYALARRLLKDVEKGWLAPLLLCGATYLPSYAFAIWPHALALAMTLGSTLCLVSAASAASPSRRGLLAAGSGLLCALAVSVRVDAVLQGVALFAWLRLFASPGDRRTGLAFLAGGAAGLAACAAMNLVKYGVFLPITYGPENQAAAQTEAAYAPIALAVGAGLAAFAVIDVRAIPWRRLRSRTVLVLGVAACLAGVWILRDRVVDLLHGLYVLLLDLNALPDDRFQPGLFRDSYGYVAYWGKPKKALLQSLPYACLIILPAIGFIRGRKVTETSLSLMMIAAPILFYGMKYWHGGMSYDMRYFIPALPFICILSIDSLQTLDAARKVPNRMDWVLRGSALAVMLIAAAALSPPQSSRGLLIYPQTVAAIVCAALTALVLLRSSASRAAAMAGCLCIGMAASVCAADLFHYLKDRSNNIDAGRAVMAMAPTGSLIVSYATSPYDEVVREGRFTISPVDAARASRAAIAFHRAGRCVLFRNEPQVAPLRERFGPALKPVGGVDGLGGFLSLDPEACTHAR